MRSRQAEILGTTTVTDRYCMSLIKNVREALDDEVEIGDQIVYLRDGDRIVIEPA